MSRDIVPELLEAIQKDFNSSMEKSSKLHALKKMIENETATYAEVNDYAKKIGELLSKSLQKNISSDVLPDGKMYFNIAKRILEPTLGNNYKLVTEVATMVQKTLNRKNKINIKPQVPKVNKNRIDGFLNRVSNEDNFDDVNWILGEPITDFTQSVVNDFVDDNIKFQYKAGLRPKLIRKENGRCCDWCKSVVGTYKYPDVPKDVYKRHSYCKCTVEYYPGNSKRQNVWDKKWRDLDKKENIEARKNFDLKERTKSYSEKTYGAVHGAKIDSIVESADKTTQEVYNKYQDSFKTNNKNYEGRAAFYDPSTGSVTLNISDAANGSIISAPYQVYFHEYGHMIDYLSNSQYFAISETFVGSNGRTLGETARYELKEKLDIIKKENKFARKSEAANKYIEYLRKSTANLENGDLSDILEGAGIGESYPLGAGHGMSYWKNRNNGKEIFAEMFSAEMSNPQSLALIKRELPKTYDIYRELLKTMLGDEL